MTKRKNLKANNSQGNQAVSQRPRKKILGMDVRDLGAAIAAAVVSEIAQVALQKAAQDSDSDNPIDLAQQSAQGAADSVKQAWNDNPLQHGASVVAGAMNQVNPSLAKLANAVKDASKPTTQSIGEAADMTQQTAADTTKGATESVEDKINSMGNTAHDVIQKATEKVLASVEEVNPDKKHKKNKGKGKGSNKKHKKKSKK